MTLAYVLTLITVLLLAVGQILFKMTAQRIDRRSLVEILGNSIVLLPAPFLFTASLRSFGFLLGADCRYRAYFLMSLSFVIVPVISAFGFSEHFTVGGAMIIAGVLITQLWS